MALVAAGASTTAKLRHGDAFRFIGLAFGEVSLLIVEVAFGFADRKGHGERQTAQKAFQIVGILSGGIDADVKMGVRMLLVELLQTLAQSLVTDVGLHDK